METGFTLTQKQRLAELGAPPAAAETLFPSDAGRDAAFRALEGELKKANRARLVSCLDERHKSVLLSVEETLSAWLTEKEGFTRVSTPAIITKDMLDKMTITDEHPLSHQVFWLDPKHCLRPMLAPNLYVLMRDMKKAAKRPVQIFEIGSCFRKESSGAQHLNEFTMLNLVDFAGTKDGEQLERLKRLAAAAMDALGITDYSLSVEASEVYGETVDIVASDGTELASGAYGPHPLDAAWGIFDETWVGLGLGLERIAMVKGGFQNIRRVGRSISYFDGAKLTL